MALGISESWPHRPGARAYRSISASLYGSLPTYEAVQLGSQICGSPGRPKPISERRR
jgi:hypothetical protein